MPFIRLLMDRNGKMRATGTPAMTYLCGMGWQSEVGVSWSSHWAISGRGPKLIKVIVFQRPRDYLHEMLICHLSHFLAISVRTWFFILIFLSGVSHNISYSSNRNRGMKYTFGFSKKWGIVHSFLLYITYSKYGWNLISLRLLGTYKSHIVGDISTQTCPEHESFSFVRMPHVTLVLISSIGHTLPLLCG